MIDLESVEEAQGVTQLFKDWGKIPGFNHKNIKSGDLVQFVQRNAASLGRQRLGSISISDFNPVVEDQKSGRLIATLFYYLCIGLC